MTGSVSLRSSALASGLAILLIPLLSLLTVTSAANTAVSGNTKYVEAATADGQSIWLKDARKPALYTQNFGDCLGSSLINVTRFDAAYYSDNMTVLFHLEGNTNVANESLMSILSPFRTSFDALADHRQCTSESSPTVNLASTSPSIHAMLKSTGSSGCPL